MSRLLAEISAVIPEFRHIRPSQVLVSATFARSQRRAGLLAYVLPLKYRLGSPVERRVRGQKEYHWAMLPVVHGGIEVLYIVYFMLPRFLHLTLREKLETVVHELYHISPEFNGDLRRFKGRSALHGDMKSYDARVRELTEIYLQSPHDSSSYAFLQGKGPREDELSAFHVPEPRPKLLKVALLGA